MSVSDFEEQVLTYLWRGVVLAGLITVLGSAFVPLPSPQIPGQVGIATRASVRVEPGLPPAHKAR